jgi:hypothetical protein
VAIRNCSFEITTGCELFANTTPVGVSGGAAKLQEYTQPTWPRTVITKVGFATGTLAAGASANIDLQALTGPDGSTVSLSTLIALYIQVTSTTGLLTIGNAASNGNQLDFGAVTHTRTLRPGADGGEGPGHAVGDPSNTGYAVDATHRIVKLLNSHGTDSVTYALYAGGA